MSDQSAEARLRELAEQWLTEASVEMNNTDDPRHWGPSSKRQCAYQLAAALAATPDRASASGEPVFTGDWIVEDLGEGDVVTLWMGGVPRNLPRDRKWMFEDIRDRHNAAIQAARTAPSLDERKVSVLDACASIFTGLRAVVDVLKRQKEAKQNVAVEWNDGWNDGYGAAMEDAIKSIESFMEEINGKPTAAPSEDTKRLVLQIVGNEPEMPGGMPRELRRLLLEALDKNNWKAVEEIFRAPVRVAKRNIAKAIDAAMNAAKENVD